MASQLPRQAPECFCFSLKWIEPNYAFEPKHYSNPPDSLWIPPSKRNAINLISNSNWHFWHNGIVKEMPEAGWNHVQTYCTSSMFWGHDRQAFLASPCDCTQTDINTQLGGDNGISLHWRKISFHNNVTNHQCLSLIGYNYNRDQLGATGSPAWMPQLLPEVYQYHGTTPSHRTCQLAGNLSLLLGLAAFSIPRETPIEEIGALLRRTNSGTEWAGHARTTGSMTECYYFTTKALTLCQGSTSAGWWSVLVSSLTLRRARVTLERGKKADMVQSCHEHSSLDAPAGACHTISVLCMNILFFDFCC
jgi:hypothetical protein